MLHTFTNKFHLSHLGRKYESCNVSPKSYSNPESKNAELYSQFQQSIMKKALYLFSIGLLFFRAPVTAQQVNIDSLTLIAQIGQDQLELGKLQNMVYQRTLNKEGAALKSQSSANDNASAAEALSADPDNKKLANDASNKAGDAKSDAKNSRKQSGKLDDLNQKIMDLKTKINGEQYKLSLYSPALPAATPVMAPMPARADTTIHP
jgi:hypothetical protein